MKTTIIAGGVLVLVAIGMSALASEKETAIKREALPAPVQSALDARYPGAEVLGMSEEKEKGKTLYEIEMKVAGRRVDAVFAADGARHEEEAEIPASELPAAVTASHGHSAQAKSTINRVEKITLGTDKAASRYELLVTDGKKQLELVYAADGKRLSAKKTDEKD